MVKLGPLVECAGNRVLLRSPSWKSFSIALRLGPALQVHDPGACPDVLRPGACLLAQHSLLMEEPAVHRELSRLPVCNRFHTLARGDRYWGVSFTLSDPWCSARPSATPTPESRQHPRPGPWQPRLGGSWGRGPLPCLGRQRGPRGPVSSAEEAC